MFSLYYYLFVALVSVVFFLWSMRRREIFRIEVREGRAEVVRGRVPPGMLGEIRALVAQPPPVRRATIFAFRGLSAARIYASGDLDASRQQRIRNIFSLYPTAQLRVAEEPESRSVWEMLGLMIKWLIGRR